ncbi:MAG: hypothetical protein Q8P18_10440 [Pseudomonadota bacterium]|nr:hypothetical protein [Pseudomonadota bacterium]
MAGPDDRVEISTAVAVRGDMGFFFGLLKWVEPARLMIEVDAELEPGDEVDVRITLAPTTSTALLNAVVTRPLVTASGETPRYLFGIRRMAADERALLDDWIRNVRNRGTFASFETVSTRSSDSGNGQSNPDVRRALERMARKGSGTPSPATDPFGVRSDISTAVTRATGRGAMRDALHGAISRGTAGRSAEGAQDSPAPSTPPASPPLTSGPGRVVASGGTYPGFAVPNGAPTRDPSFAVTQTRTSNWMQVTWEGRAAFDRDARLQLCNYVLVLVPGTQPLPQRLPDQEPLRIMLRHAEIQLECAATIKAYGPDSATYRLMLDPLQIATLRQWGQDYIARR